MIRMTFYASRNADGIIHVTNTVGGLTGQHHVHDEASWQEWLAGDPERHIGPVPQADIEWLPATTQDCTCGQPVWRRAPKLAS